MAGTSVDGVDAALVRFTGDRPDVELLAFRTLPYTPDERAVILETMHGGGVRSCAFLDVELGRRFADAAAEVLDQAGVSPRDLAFVASHGQTIWHEPGRATLQLGDPAVIAEALARPVVSHFRNRDVAAGGQGAPLVPIADCVLFAAADHPRVLLNLGGMANVTWVQAGGDLDSVIAFDTGPGVAVIDAVVRALDPEAAYDEGGRRARRGTVHAATVARLLEEPYFSEPPPKSTGRERFGESVAADLIATLRGDGAADDDCVATAVAFTAASVAEQVRRWLPADAADVVASGGGVRNPALLAAVAERLAPTPVVRFDDLYFDGDAKEALAFAFLGWLTLHGRAGNVPSATGAEGPRVLGRITPA